MSDERELLFQAHQRILQTYVEPYLNLFFKDASYDERRVIRWQLLRDFRARLALAAQLPRRKAEGDYREASRHMRRNMATRQQAADLWNAMHNPTLEAVGRQMSYTREWVRVLLQQAREEGIYVKGKY